MRVTSHSYRRGGTGTVVVYRLSPGALVPRVRPAHERIGHLILIAVAAATEGIKESLAEFLVHETVHDGVYTRRYIG